MGRRAFAKSHSMYDLNYSHGQINQMIYQNHFLRNFAIMFVSKIKFLNFPDSVNTRLIARSLFFNEYTVFFKHDTYGFMCLPATSTGDLNYSGEPIYLQPLAENGKYIGGVYENHVNCVIMRNNIFCIPGIANAQYYAQILQDIESTAQMNLYVNRIPFIINTPKNMLLTVKNIIKQISDYSPVVVENKEAKNIEFSLLNTNVPYLLDKLDDHFTNKLNEYLTLEGINNFYNDKKERVLTDEVNANNDLVGVMRNSQLECLKDSCKEINKIFGLETDVEFTTSQEIEPMFDSGGGEN